MTKTRKGFLKAGAIIGIISAILVILSSFIIFSFGTKITEDKTVELLKLSDELQYVEEGDGSYYFVETDEEGNTLIIDQETVKITSKVLKFIVIGFATIELALSVSFLILSIKLLSKTQKGIYSKGLTISTLVISALVGELIVLAFIIIALCSKNKKNPADDYEQITIQ